MGGDANIASRHATRSSADGTSDAEAPARASDDRARANADATARALDRRHDTPGASRRRRDAENALLDALLETPAPRMEPVGAEGQVLLMRGLARLERQEDVEGAVAWSLDPDGKPTVIGALPVDVGRRVPPTPALYHALAQLDRVQRLTDTNLVPGLAPLLEAGVSAVAPIEGLAQTPSAVLLVFPNRIARALRPRTVAVLGEVADRLARTLSTNLAVERMTRLDGAVRRLDRLSALGGLVSEIVHEIRNPLVSVKTFLQLLPDRIDDPEFHGEFRGVVEDEVARLERMLTDLLRHARPTPVASAASTDARIEDAVSTTLQLLTYRCREKGIALETSLREELPGLALSEDALRQLLLNLLLNATQVTPAGGTIRVEANWSLESANHVRLVVEDQGPGLPPEAAAHVFEPFWTTRSDGAGGLGLSICKRIVDDANGTIAVDPEWKSGARFVVELPITR